MRRKVGVDGAYHGLFVSVVARVGGGGEAEGGGGRTAAAETGVGVASELRC